MPWRTLFHFKFFVRSWLCGFFGCFLFRFCRAVLRVILTERVSFQSEPNSGEHVLLEALGRSQDPLLRHLAFEDLCTLTRFSPARRQFFWREPKGEHWVQLLNLCCDNIDNVTTSIYELKVFAQEQKEWEKIPEPFYYKWYRRLFVPFPIEDPFAEEQLKLWAIEGIPFCLTDKSNFLDGLSRNEGGHLWSHSEHQWIGDFDSQSVGMLFGSGGISTQFRMASIR